MRFSHAFAQFVLLATPIVAQNNFMLSSPPQYPLITQAFVHLSVEGGHFNFDGDIHTTGHDITTDSSPEPHHCDGTNADHHSTPGATCTTALADAAAQSEIKWDATFNVNLDDFIITSIHGIENNDDTHWAWIIYKNGEALQFGGCQVQVATGDEVLFKYERYEADHCDQ